MTLVSIIIPTYNRPELLVRRALATVRGQTHQELDIIVVSDGPEPVTKEAVEALGDPRIRYFDIPRTTYPEDPGQKWQVVGLHARNFGHDQAQGEWVGGLDDDDEFTLDHVEVLLNHAGDEDFVYGKSDVHWSDGTMGQYGSWPPGHFQFCDGAGIWKRSLGYRYDWGCIERGLPEDGDLWDRMVAGGVTFAFVNQVVHHYYPNPR